MSDAISDDERLYRRLHPVQIDPAGRPTSAAFKDSSLSVDRAALTTPAASLGDFAARGYGLASLTAGFARGVGQEVVPDPILRNPAHALVRGNKPRSVARALAQAAVIEIAAQPAQP